LVIAENYGQGMMRKGGVMETDVNADAEEQKSILHLSKERKSCQTLFGNGDKLYKKFYL
jgi:hypothetical protein